MNLCNVRPQPTLEEISSFQTPKVTVTPDTSNSSVKEEATGSEVLLKTWNSFPEQLNEVDLVDSIAIVKTMTRNTGAVIKEEKKELKERIAQSIELSDVIKVDYSDSKEVEGSMFTEKTSPGTL